MATRAHRYAGCCRRAVQLKGAGAHDFLIADVTDIGLVPAVQAAGPLAVGAATQIATELNTALFAALAAVDTPGTNIHLLDLFGGLHQVHDDPAAFGITKFTSACAADTSCIADPNGAFFWDGIHTTTMGDSIIAAAALAAVPEPSIVWLMLLGVAGLGLWRCRAGICQSIRTFLSSS